MTGCISSGTLQDCGSLNAVDLSEATRVQNCLKIEQDLMTGPYKSDESTVSVEQIKYQQVIQIF